MCDKRFMPKNRSNVGENVTINHCISTLISYSAFKKDWKGIILQNFLDHSYFYAFWVQIFKAQLIDKKSAILLWFYYVPVICNRAPFPRTRETAETLIFRHFPCTVETMQKYKCGKIAQLFPSLLSGLGHGY